jgi:BASS family bile acid:Na+ symporter
MNTARGVGYLAIGCLVLSGFAAGGGRPSTAAVLLVAGLAGAAVWMFLVPTLRPFAFTCWVLTFVAASMAWPAAFEEWAGLDLRVLIVPLIQIITFGMGTTLNVDDFTRVLRMPWAVFIGMTLQFTVMPVLGWSFASLFGFPPEIAAGIILIGSVSGSLIWPAVMLHSPSP